MDRWASEPTSEDRWQDWKRKQDYQEKLDRSRPVRYGGQIGYLDENGNIERVVSMPEPAGSLTPQGQGRDKISQLAIQATMSEFMDDIQNDLYKIESLPNGMDKPALWNMIASSPEMSRAYRKWLDIFEANPGRSPLELMQEQLGKDQTDAITNPLGLILEADNPNEATLNLGRKTLDALDEAYRKASR